MTDEAWVTPEEPALHRAARLGDHLELTRLLDAGEDLEGRADLEIDNGPHLRKLTPLMVAARSIDGASVATLRLLLDRGADLRAVSEGGNTAAWYAAGKGGRWEFHEWRIASDHVDRLRFLLDAGLDPHERNSAGRSLIREACHAGDPARVKLLLERGASVVPTKSRIGPPAPKLLDAPASYEIPLFVAAQSGSAECVRLLVAAGADVNARSDAGETALFEAGSADAARALVAAGIDVRAQNVWKGDALSSQLALGHEREVLTEIFAVLVNAGVDAFGLPNWPHTRLAQAAFRTNLEAVELLLALGAPVHPPHGAPSALHQVCWQGSSDEEGDQVTQTIIRALVAAGLEPGFTNVSGSTPLHEACDGDWPNPAAVRALIDLGAAADPVDATGSSPLMAAASNGEVEIVRLLLAHGADPLRVDRRGRSVLEIAKHHHKTWLSLYRDATDDETRERYGASVRDAEESLAAVNAALARGRA